jgi:hypothetical protein
MRIRRPDLQRPATCRLGDIPAGATFRLAFDVHNPPRIWMRLSKHAAPFRCACIDDGDASIINEETSVIPVHGTFHVEADPCDGHPTDQATGETT